MGMLRAPTRAVALLLRVLSGQSDCVVSAPPREVFMTASYQVRKADGARKRILPLMTACCVLAAATVVLHLSGRRWWCACGQLTPWVSAPNGPHTSQHLAD